MSLDLDHVMLRLGRILTADSSLEVVVRGAKPYAVPGRVVLPAVETYEGLGEDGERVLHGVADHEFGHAADTDFAALAEAQAEGEAFAALANALEDGYVERRRITLYPGARYNLEKLHDWFAEHSVADRLEDPEGNLWEQFVLATAVDASPVNDLDRYDVRPEVLEMVAKARPLYAQLDDLRHESQQTPAVLEMARAVWEAVKPPDPPPEEQPPGEDDGEGDSDEDDEDDEDSEQGEEESEEEEGEDEDDEDEEGEEEVEGDPPPLGEGDGEELIHDDEDSPSDPLRAALEDFEVGDHEAMSASDAAGDELQAALEEGKDTYEVFDPSFDIARDFSGEYTDGLSKAFERDVAAADEVSDELVNAFEARLQSVTRRRLTFADAGPDGVLDSNLLPAFSLGSIPSDDLWLDYTAEVAGGHAAVAVLIDCSGSMATDASGSAFPPGAVRVIGRQRFINPAAPGSKAYLARLCAIAITKALTRCQVPHEVTGFTTIRSSAVEEHGWAGPTTMHGFFHEHFRRLRAVCIEAEDQGVDLSTFARTCRHARGDLQLPFHAVLKGFAHDDARALELIAGIGENLDGESVLWQARRLARRPERRKVMFVLSDGYPAGSNDDYAAKAYLKRTVARVASAGVEVYGIGIMSGAVRRFYPRSWVCKQLADLPEVVMRALTETVVEGDRGWDKLL